MPASEKIFANFGAASQLVISLLKTSYIKGLNIKLDSESTTRIGKEGLRFFKFNAKVMPAKPAPTITIGFCIDFISEISLCVNVLLNYTNNFQIERNNIKLITNWKND